MNKHIDQDGVCLFECKQKDETREKEVSKRKLKKIRKYNEDVKIALILNLVLD